MNISSFGMNTSGTGMNANFNPNPSGFGMQIRSFGTPSISANDSVTLKNNLLKVNEVAQPLLSSPVNYRPFKRDGDIFPLPIQPSFPSFPIRPLPRKFENHAESGFNANASAGNLLPRIMPHIRPYGPNHPIDFKLHPDFYKMPHPLGIPKDMV